MSMIDDAPAPIRRATSAAARANTALASRASTRPSPIPPSTSRRSSSSAARRCAPTRSRPSDAIIARSCAADDAATTSSASKGTSRRSAQSTAGPFQVSIGATTAKAASSPHRPDGTDTANAPPAARANASSPRMACQSAPSIRCEKTVDGGSAVATTTATASARSSQARCSSRCGHRAVELTGRPPCSGLPECKWHDPCLLAQYVHRSRNDGGAARHRDRPARITTTQGG